MTVTKTKKLEGCIEGSNVYDLLLSETISKQFIDYIGKLGKLVYHESMEKPLFVVIVRGEMTIKGVEGNKTIRVLLPDKAGSSRIDDLKSCIQNFE